MTVYFEGFPIGTPLHERNKGVSLVLTEASFQCNLCELKFGPRLEWLPWLIRVKLRSLDFASTFVILFERDGFSWSLAVWMIFNLDIVD